MRKELEEIQEKIIDLGFDLILDTLSNEKGVIYCGCHSKEYAEKWLNQDTEPINAEPNPNEIINTLCYLDNFNRDDSNNVERKILDLGEDYEPRYEMIRKARQHAICLLFEIYNK